MQLLKIVFAFIAVGVPVTYALFKFTHDAPAWVKVLGFVAGIATLVGVIISLPQALDALEATANRVAGYFSPSPEEQHRRADVEARKKADEAERQRGAEEARAKEAREREAREQEARERDARQREAREREARERDARERELREREAREREARERDARERAEREREARAREAQARAAREQERQRLIELVRRDRCKAISLCPTGRIFDLARGECIPLQYYGGVIPGSADDQSFINGRWVPNCR